MGKRREVPKGKKKVAEVAKNRHGPLEVLNFEEKLDDLITDAMGRRGGLSYDAVISKLELKLMAMREEQAGASRE